MRKVVLAALVAALVAWLGVSGAAPSKAATTITGVERVENSTASQVWVHAGTTVSCPSYPTQKSVISGSAYITGGNGKVVIDKIYPSDDLTQVSVDGKVTDPGSQGTWSITAVAVCADKPSGLERNQIPSVTDSASPKLIPAYAGCSSGKTLLGTGFDIVGGEGEVGVYHVVPTVNGAAQADGVEVNAVETDPLATDWRVDAIGICADATYPELVVSANAGGASDPGNSVNVYCPYGSVATGAGFAVDDALGEIVVTTTDAGNAGDSSTFGSRMYAIEEDGTINVWTPRAYAICANR